MTYPKISIITPSFNQGCYIEETILSVINQNYPNLEYFVIDGGSTDNTVDIIRKYQKHLSWWVSEKDRGQSDAINKGFSRATGEIINWLNSDDYYEPGALKKIGQIFQDPTVNVYCGTNRSYGQGADGYSAGTDVYVNNLHKTIGMARIDQPETFFRKSCLDAIGYLNEDLHYVMDRDLWVRYLCKFGLRGIIKESTLLVHFRLHGQSKTVSMQQRFKEESRNLYYTYALCIGLSDYSDIFRLLFPVKQVALSRLPALDSEFDWQRIFNYFLLLQGLEAYAQNNYPEGKKIFKYIKESLLTREEQRDMARVIMRMNWIPVDIKKLWNRLH